MKNLSKIALIFVLMMIGLSLKAQQGTIYIRDGGPLTTYTIYVHVYDANNGYSEIATSPLTLTQTFYANVTQDWHGGPGVPQDSDPRWLVRLQVVRSSDATIRDSYYGTLLSSTQYFYNQLTMPSVKY